MGLKERIISWQLGKKATAVSRTKKFVNLSQCTSAGIIWHEDNRAAFEVLKKRLNESKIKTTDLCFSNHQRETTFTAKDFSLLGGPTKPSVADFVDQRFDILFDITLSGSGVLQVVRGLSKASFKAGWSPAKPDFFDFTVDVSQQPDAQFLAEQLIHYLSEIK